MGMREGVVNILLGWDDGGGNKLLVNEYRTAKHHFSKLLKMAGEQ